MKSESEDVQSCLTVSDPWTAAYQAPPSMGFSRQEYWSGLPLPSPELGAKKLNKFLLTFPKFTLLFMLIYVFLVGKITRQLFT